MVAQRLQKVLASAGLSSRRAAESLILEGRVRVNGRIVRELGTKADPRRDRIEVDGKRVMVERPVYLILNKPRKIVTTLHDPEGRETVSSLLRGVEERVFPVGRLDYHTSGALILTNDGEMTNALLHPARGVPKVYWAKINGHPSLPALEALRKGVTLDDGYQTAGAEVFVLREEKGHTWLQITLHEGKNRQVHRMLDAVGHRVMRLVRSSFAEISIEGLKPGEYRMLGEREVEQLKKKYLAPYRRSRKRKREAEEEFLEER